MLPLPQFSTSVLFFFASSIKLFFYLFYFLKLKCVFDLCGSLEHWVVTVVPEDATAWGWSQWSCAECLGGRQCLARCLGTSDLCFVHHADVPNFGEWHLPECCHHDMCIFTMAKFCRSFCKFSHLFFSNWVPNCCELHSLNDGIQWRLSALAVAVFSSVAAAPLWIEGRCLLHCSCWSFCVGTFNSAICGIKPQRYQLQQSHRSLWQTWQMGAGNESSERDAKVIHWTICQHVCKCYECLWQFWSLEIQCASVGRDERAPHPINSCIFCCSHECVLMEWSMGGSTAPFCSPRVSSSGVWCGFSQRFDQCFWTRKPLATCGGAFCSCAKPATAERPGLERDRWHGRLGRHCHVQLLAQCLAKRLSVAKCVGEFGADTSMCCANWWHHLQCGHQCLWSFASVGDRCWHG